MRSITTTLLIVTLALSWLLGCTSRYRRELYMAAGEDRRKVTVVTTEYIPGVRLTNLYADRKVTPGAGSCLVLSTQTRGRTVDTEFLQEFVQFDENLQSDLYLQLPPVPAPDSIDLTGNAVVQLRGRYEQPMVEKVFLPDPGGKLVVDSIVSEHLYARIDGVFTSQAGQQVTFDGNFRARID
ncbi:hypothetical protein GF420_07735 [candidate division GN15 bacterium]|nr:hypothetical protein [candidate division GN15 bacterium]